MASCLLDVRAESFIPAKTIRNNTNQVQLALRSRAALLYDERENEIIMQHNSEEVLPIASLTKLMMAMVLIDAELDMNKPITLSRADKDRLRYSSSRLRTGMKFTRRDLLFISLAASENRAALALSRTFPGGTDEFIKAMNHSAREMGLSNTKFSDAAGLSDDNVSNARELVRMVSKASNYPLIREFTTRKRGSVLELKSQREVEFVNTNRLLNRKTWPITLSKTGFTSVAGNCLVMQTKINQRPVIIVLLESWGKLSKYGDSNRIRKWLLKTERLLDRKSVTVR